MKVSSYGVHVYQNQARRVLLQMLSKQASLAVPMLLLFGVGCAGPHALRNTQDK